VVSEPTPALPLSAGAEDLLRSLEEWTSREGPDLTSPHAWLSALLTRHPDALGSSTEVPQLEALRTLLAEQRDSGRIGGAITREALVQRAGHRAREEGRPLIASQDLAWAIMSIALNAMESGGEPVSSPPSEPDSSLPQEPRAPNGRGAVFPSSSLQRDPEPLPPSMATEEMFEQLRSRLRVEEEESVGLDRWLDALLADFGSLVGDEDDQSRVRTVQELVAEGSSETVLLPTPDLKEIRAVSSSMAREAGRPLLAREDVALAVLSLATEVAEQMISEPTLEEETEEEPPIFEPVGEQEEPDPDFHVEFPQEKAAPSGRARTFRLFVSSTFRDLTAERNALQEITFPRLEAFCTRHSCRFQAIDLRWGVSEEAALDQQTMNICLGEIERCRQVTPRPNFLIVLGDRYGWVPPPPQIPAQEFEALLGLVTDPEEAERLNYWYRKDMNADPPEYRLQPRSGERKQFRDFDAWAAEERALVATFRTVVENGGLSLPPERRAAYLASATEQEVLAGALQIPDPEQKVFCAFRDLVGYPTDSAGNPREQATEFVSSAESGRQATAALKGKLREHLPPSAIRTQKVEWDGGRPGITSEYLEDLALWTAERLEEAILLELAEPQEERHLTPLGLPDEFAAEAELAIEVRDHLAFAAERREFFVGREDGLHQIHQYLAETDPAPLAVIGEGGSGKSALMAQALGRISSSEGNQLVMARFVGATPGSADGRHLLEGLCREIQARLGGEREDLPTDYQELVGRFSEHLERASPDRPLILFIDSLDQLEEPARNLGWIPSTLPAHVRLVVSTRTEKGMDALEQKSAQFLEIGPLSRADGRELSRSWLNSGSRPRRLQPPQENTVLDAFVESGGNPLYLRLATEEARQWAAWANPETDEPAELETEPLGLTVPGIIRDNLFSRLSHEDNHGQVLVSRTLGYLAASRQGLAEDELIRVLSRDPEVYAWFLEGAEHVPQDLVELARGRWGGGKKETEGVDPSRRDEDQEIIRRLLDLRKEPGRLRRALAEDLDTRELRLPVVLWSRLLSDLEPYLTHRSAEGGSLLTFYHRELGEVAEATFLEGEAEEGIHRHLARYFRDDADPSGDGNWDGDGTRGLSELPFHLTHGSSWDELYETLTDFVFLEQKAARVGVQERRTPDGSPEKLYTGVFQLQDDFDRALAALPGGTGGAGRKHPLIATAVDFGQGFVVRCPWCNTTHRLDRDWLGKEIPCPNPDCEGPLKVNEFTAGGNP